MSGPKVSIIVSLYNYSQYIGDCIKSIENQDYNNWELIVVDDCSTDNSYKVAKRLAKLSSRSIKVMQTQQNSGYSTAKNEGIIASSGDYVATLDADDMLTRNSIGSRIKAAIDNDVPFVHGDSHLVGPDDTLKMCYKKGGRRGSAFIDAQTVLMARWVYQKYGLYDENLRSRADKEMWWRLFGRYGTKVKHLPEGAERIKRLKIHVYVAYYRKHLQSMLKMRKRNRAYDQRMTKILWDAYLMRQDRITQENTRFLME